MIEQTRFLSTVFLGSEFKLENIYSGVNYCGRNVCGNLFLRIARKIPKSRARQNFVLHGSLEPMFAITSNYWHLFNRRLAAESKRQHSYPKFLIPPYHDNSNQLLTLRNISKLLRDPRIVYFLAVKPSFFQNTSFTSRSCFYDRSSHL